MVFRFNKHLFKTLFLCVIAANAFLANAESAKNTSNDSNDGLLDHFIQAKGPNAFFFDASNIKQFWTDKSVVSKDNTIVILLNEEHKTSPWLNIQLANVLETQDCKVEVVSENKDLVFSIANRKLEILSKSTDENDFVQYHVYTSTFHLEDLDDFSFKIQFSSPQNNPISIKKIIFSFTANKESAFLGSPGFEQLLKEIDAKGISVPNSDVKYLISEENNKLFVKIPKEIPLDSWFIYHIVPGDPKDLLPGREEHGFNNYDFSPSNKPHALIPKAYASNSNYSIIHIQLPSYRYSSLDFGQAKGDERYWRTQIYKK